MGICLQSITGEGPSMTKNVIMNRDTGFCWIVGRREPKPDGPSDWYIQGVADREDVAVEMCMDDTYFIGPLPINTALPHARIEWVGSYFPLRTQQPQESISED